MIEVMDIVRQGIVKQDTAGSQHTLRLLSLLEKTYTSIERWKLQLAEQGFVWIITTKYILNLKYHVNIRGSGIKYYSDTQAIRYVGDIPDFALNRAESAIRLGIEVITLHSMNPLPVERIHIDPVMVGWIQDPKIHTDISGRFFSYDMKAEGIVLAIWDNEKELEL